MIFNAIRNKKSNSQFNPAKRGWLRFIFSLILATGAAYAFSFAVDLLIGGLVGVYPVTVFIAVVTWSIISAASIWVAVFLSKCSRWLAIPYAGFGTLAVLGGLSGVHPHDFVVAALMFLHSLLVWLAFQTQINKAKPCIEILNNCDLSMVRDELVAMHQMIDTMAEGEGGQNIFKTDYVVVWQKFRENPSINNAQALLAVAPHLLEYFERCCPDQTFYQRSRYLKSRGINLG